MKLIDVQERESKRIAELARVQGQLTGEIMGFTHTNETP